MSIAMDEVRRRLLDAHTYVLGGPGPSDPTGQARPLIPELDSLSLDEAYALQHETVSALCAMWGATPAGFKISATTRADQERMGATEPTFGRLTDQHLLVSGSSIRLDRANGPLLEPELAMRTTVELDGSADLADIRAAVEMAPALEIPISRFADWWPEGEPPRLTLPSLIADNSLAGYLVVGDTWTRPTQAALSDVPMQISTPGGEVIQGHSSNVLGDPFLTMAWILEALSRRGESLHAGSVVATGTFTPPIRVRAGTYQASFGCGIGSVEVTFIS